MISFQIPDQYLYHEEKTMKGPELCVKMAEQQSRMRQYGANLNCRRPDYLTKGLVHPYSVRKLLLLCPESVVDKGDIKLNKVNKKLDPLTDHFRG